MGAAAAAFHVEREAVRTGVVALFLFCELKE
jgi:hypothetical protein